MIYIERGVVTILKYVFLGLLLYVLIIPVLEQLAVLACQWLENLKGKLLYQSALLQKELDKLQGDTGGSAQTHAIGFSIPIEEDYEYEEEEDEDS